MDEFNLGILHNQNWGKDPYVNPGGIAAKDGLLKHKPRDKDIGSIIGTMPKKPREREVLEIRAKTSQE